VQVVIEADGHEDAEHRSVVHQVAQIDRDALSVDTLGLQLDEAKNLLQKVHAVLIDERVRTCLAEQVACPSGSRARAHTDTHPSVTRTLFGTFASAVVRAGITVPVNRRRRAYSARWPRRCPSGPRLSC